MSRDDLDNIPDLRDGLTRKERVVLYCIDQIQKERGGRNVPTVMLYGRVVEHVNIRGAGVGPTHLNEIRGIST